MRVTKKDQSGAHEQIAAWWHDQNQIHKENRMKPGHKQKIRFIPEQGNRKKTGIVARQQPRLLRSFQAVLALGLFFASATVWADRTHNIQNFYGERAPGLAGAYGAIADDPSGAFYNPAGLAFAYDGYISISASNYKEVKYVYEGVFGPGQDYKRSYDKFTPNFLGAVKRLDEDWMFAVSLINPYVESFDQADRILFPQYQPNTNRISIDYSDDSSLLLGGPSVAWSSGENFALGFSLLYFNDKQKNTTSVLFQNKDGSYNSNNSTLHRQTMGFQPVLGLQYMPDDRFAIGLSASHHIITSEFARERFRNMTVTQRPGGGLQALLVELEASDSGPAMISTNLGQGIYGPPAVGKIPQTWESRIGFAWFASRYLLVSADLIYTSGYQEHRVRSFYNAFQNIIVLRDSNEPGLFRRPTTNYALGLEYFITDTFAIRLGGYSNLANTPDKKDTLISILDNTVTRSQSPASGLTVTQNLGYYYEPNQSDELEHVDLYGYSLGFAFSSGSSSVSLSFSREFGKGWGNIADEGLPQQMRARSTAVYLTATTRN
ncbi:MAG: hypothetical protein KDK39_16110 [Leptospiraceae bacterium]|nr:hypothetical protein [Leptospiraceae bacterium]